MPNLFPAHPCTHPSERHLAALVDRHLPEALWACNVLVPPDARELDFVLACPQYDCIFAVEAKTWAGCTRIDGYQVLREAHGHDPRTFEALLQRTRELAGSWHDRETSVHVKPLVLVTSPEARLEFIPPVEARAHEGIARAESWLRECQAREHLPDWDRRRQVAASLFQRLARRQSPGVLATLGGWSSAVPCPWELVSEGAWMRVAHACSTDVASRTADIYVAAPGCDPGADPGEIRLSLREARRLESLHIGFAPLSVISRSDLGLFAIVEEHPREPVDPGPWLAGLTPDLRRVAAGIVAHQVTTLLGHGFLLPDLEHRVTASWNFGLTFQGLDQVFVTDGDSCHRLLLSVRDHGDLGRSGPVREGCGWELVARRACVGLVLGCLVGTVDRPVPTQENWSDDWLARLAAPSGASREVQRLLHRLQHRERSLFADLLAELLSLVGLPRGATGSAEPTGIR